MGAVSQIPAWATRPVGAAEDRRGFIGHDGVMSDIVEHWGGPHCQDGVGLIR
jgi:hypothetical protein